MGEVVELARHKARRTGLEPWVSKQELARHLGFSTRWVEMQVRKGMPCKRLGGRLRFQITQAEAWLEQVS